MAGNENRIAGRLLAWLMAFNSF